VSLLSEKRPVDATASDYAEQRISRNTSKMKRSRRISNTYRLEIELARNDTVYRFTTAFSVLRQFAPFRCVSRRLGLNYNKT